MDVLHTMYPDMKDMPEPTSILFHRWYNDPLARGSYSNWPASFFQEHHDNLRATVSDRLWFTGEHCSQKYFVRAFFFCLLMAPSLILLFLDLGFLAWRLVRRARRRSRTRCMCIKGGGCANVREHFDQVKNARPYKVDEGGDQGNVNPDDIEIAVFTGLRCSIRDDRSAAGDAWDPGPSCDTPHPLSHTFRCCLDHSGLMRAVLERGLLRWNDNEGAYSVPNQRKRGRSHTQLTKNEHPLVLK
jgi:hypothetical protein